MAKYSHAERTSRYRQILSSMPIGKDLTADEIYDLVIAKYPKTDLVRANIGVIVGKTLAKRLDRVIMVKEIEVLEPSQGKAYPIAIWRRTR